MRDDDDDSLTCAKAPDGLKQRRVAHRVQVRIGFIQHHEKWIAVERSGKADALSGRFIEVYDDLDELIRRADEITRDNLYSITRTAFKHESAS